MQVEPYDRQRLDHYGHGGRGWDSDGWERNYAGPLTSSVERTLEPRFAAGSWAVEVDEKGFVMVDVH